MTGSQGSFPNIALIAAKRLDGVHVCCLHSGQQAEDHADQGGEKTVNMPFAVSSVTDIISGKKIPLSVNGKSFKVNFKKYETRLYKFEK